VQAATEAAKRGGSVGPEDLVFTSSIGTPLEPRNANRVFTDLLKTAGLRPIRFHDLRHTCASLLLAQGVSPRVVMETLGHSAVAVTMNTYGHVMPLAQREAADRMNELFV
jgi:integrase